MIPDKAVATETIPQQTTSESNTTLIATIIVSIVLVIAVALVVAVYLFYCKKRQTRNNMNTSAIVENGASMHHLLSTRNESSQSQPLEANVRDDIRHDNDDNESESNTHETPDVSKGLRRVGKSAKAMSQDSCDSAYRSSAPPALMTEREADFDNNEEGLDSACALMDSTCAPKNSSYALTATDDEHTQVHPERLNSQTYDAKLLLSVFNNLIHDMFI